MGAGQRFQDVTVDLYIDLESFLSGGSPIPHFEKVHAGKDMDELFDKTDAAAILLSREVRLVIDSSSR